MKKEFLYIFVVSALSMSTPLMSHAYFTTAQSAELIEDGKGILYTVTYDFGVKKCDLYMPIVPTRMDQINTLSYTVIDEIKDEVYHGGSSVGIVLSNAEIRKGAYFIPKGEARRLTLMVLLTLPADSPEGDTKLALQVTGLPFNMGCETRDISNRLNPSELQYYRTPAVSS